MKLGSWLIARGKLTGVQLKRALLDQSFYGGHLSSSLMKLGYLDEPALGEYLAQIFRVPYANQEQFREIPEQVLRMIPEQLAQKHQLVPLAVAGKKLRLAMMNPSDILEMDEVSLLTGLTVEPWISSESHLLDALERNYHFHRSTRETIPLSDPGEGPGNPHSARLRFLESSDSPGTLTSDSAAPGDPSEELGLDGRPLSLTADAVTELYPNVAVPPADVASAGLLPRSLDEWRENLEPRSIATASEEVPRPLPHAEVSPPPGVASTPTASEVSLPPKASPAVTAATQLPIPSARRAALSLVPMPPLITLEEVSERLKNSQARDEIFESILDFCAGRFSRSALFLVTQEKVVGFGGRGEGFDPDRLRATVVGLDAPSIFSYFHMGSQFYYGPVPGLPANQQFYRGLSVQPPDRVLLVPIHIKERLIALVYGDYSGTRREEPDIVLYRRLVQKAVLALEILILRNKTGML